MAKLSYLTDYLEHHALNTPSKIALACENRELSWEQLNTEAEKLAAHLAPMLGRVSSQQVIALLMPNCWQYVAAYLAVLKLGHIALPIDISYKQIEIEAITKQLSPRLVIALDNFPQLKKLGPEFRGYGEILQTKAHWKNYLRLRVGPKKQIASLLFTSGTTGQPKAVPNTHANQIWNVEVCSKAWDWTSADTLLVSLRLSHMYGLVIALSGCTYHGNTMYLQEWFDPKKTLQALASGKISIFKHVPLAYQQILAYASTPSSPKYNLSKVRLFTSGGGPLPPEVWQAFRAEFGVKIVETYGTSETGRIAGNRLNNPQPGSPGYLLPGVKANLSKDSELLIKSGGVFPGYYQNPTATSKNFTEDGWWRTGDIAELTSGRVVLKGRFQEKIRKAGYTISPRDVEWALLKNPKIKEVYVMGLQEPGRPSDQLVYFLSGNITPKELNAFCKENLLFAWRPDKVINLPNLPRTHSGKVKIPALRLLVKHSQSR